jgi:hypothetical protein
MLPQWQELALSKALYMGLFDLCLPLSLDQKLHEGFAFYFL